MQVYTHQIHAVSKSRSYRIEISYIKETKIDCLENITTLLHERELEELRKFKTVDGRKSFLLGKYSAKEAISKSHQIPLNEILIEHGIFGQPIVYPAYLDLEVSIAHTKHSSLSILYPNGLLSGCDIEIVQTNNLKSIEIALSSTELNLCEESPILLHILWSARESLSKALRLGFLVDMKILEINTLVYTNNVYMITFTYFPSLIGYSIERNGEILCLVMPKRLEFDLKFFNNLKNND